MWRVLQTRIILVCCAGATEGSALAELLPAARELQGVQVHPGAAVWGAPAKELEPEKLQGPGDHCSLPCSVSIIAMMPEVGVLAMYKRPK